MIISNTGIDALGKVGNPELDSVSFERGRPMPLDGSGVPKYVAAEMRHTLSFHRGTADKDFNCLAPAHVVEELCCARRAGANLLMNVGPTATGGIPEYEGATLRKAGDWIRLMGGDEGPIYQGRPPGIAGAGEEAIGHFGLAVRDYTHSTAPNRRFPDVIMQRTIKAARKGRPAPYSLDELNALAAHCTEQEDAANKVERQVSKSAAALLLSRRLGETFHALVTGASEKGTWVRVLHPPVEGKLVEGAHGLDVGDKVRVRLVDVDVRRGFIDFVREGGR